MPTRKITRVYRRSGPASGKEASQVHELASIVDLLSAMQQHGLSILPISSHKALGIVGRGLSGNIEQSRADSETTLVFKEGVPSKRERDTDDITDWYSLITAITILQHAPVRENPHFVDLLGISFYVPITNAPRKRAWPLLVTHRVTSGDLASFLLQEQQGLLAPGIRMQIFAEVAEAIYVLHSCGVAHGDIKLENFLIDQDEGELNVVLTDFGSSIVRGQKRVPDMSEPWAPPELYHVVGDLECDQLAQADLFAFGIISLHILISLEELSKAGLCFIRMHNENDDGWMNILNKLKMLKQSKVKTCIAEKVFNVIESLEMSTEWRELLRALVIATVQAEHGQRHLPWSQVLPHVEEYLSYSFEKDLRTQVPTPPLAIAGSARFDHGRHKTFDLTTGLAELDDTDYVLRAHIADDLVYKSVHSVCALCRKDYSLQRTLSLQFGFCQLPGDEILTGSSTESIVAPDVLAEAIQTIDSKYKFSLGVSENVRKALTNGVLVSSDRIEEYQVSRRLLSAKEFLMKEISARAECLGSEHIGLARLKWQFSLVSKALSHLQDAEVSQRGVVQILAHHFGEDHTVKLMAEVVLGEILADRDQHVEALEIYGRARIIFEAEDKLGPDHPDTTTTLQLMGLSLLALEQYEDAESAFEKVVLLREKFLSPMHALTVRAELCLATAFRLHGNLQKALAVLQRVDEKIDGLFIRDDFVKSEAYIAKAALHKELDSLEEASDTIIKAAAAVDRLKLGEADDLQIAVQQIQASIHRARGEPSME